MEVFVVPDGGHSGTDRRAACARKGPDVLRGLCFLHQYKLDVLQQSTSPSQEARRPVLECPPPGTLGISIADGPSVPVVRYSLTCLGMRPGSVGVRCSITTLIGLVLPSGSAESCPGMLGHTYHRNRQLPLSDGLSLQTTN